MKQRKTVHKPVYHFHRPNSRCLQKRGYKKIRAAILQAPLKIRFVLEEFSDIVDVSVSAVKQWQQKPGHMTANSTFSSAKKALDNSPDPMTRLKDIILGGTVAAGYLSNVGPKIVAEVIWKKFGVALPPS